MFCEGVKECSHAQTHACQLAGCRADVRARRDVGRGVGLVWLRLRLRRLSLPCTARVRIFLLSARLFLPSLLSAALCLWCVLSAALCLWGILSFTRVWMAWRASLVVEGSVPSAIHRSAAGT